MRFPPYWAKAGGDKQDSDAQTAAGWSFESYEDAQRQAQARLQRIQDALRRNDRLRREYEYDDHPLREELMERVRAGDREVAAITRNRYGALVLNTASVMFADIDLPASGSSGLLDGLLELFSASRRAKRQAHLHNAALWGVQAWFADNQGHAARVYRTHAGLRLLFTDRQHEPTSPKTVRVLESLGSDPLYLRLTQRQACFRARLTPKPWRCQHTRPPVRFPYVTPEEDEAHRQWVRAYNDKCKPFTTCLLLTTIGPEPDNPVIREIVALHDRHACHDRDMALA